MHHHKIGTDIILSHRTFRTDGVNTYAVMRKTPSLMRRRAAIAPGLRANSTIPSPVDLPRSSAITMARSISPNIENACSSSSLETNGERNLTRSAAPCVAKRTLRTRPFFSMPSSAAFAFSAFGRVSYRADSGVSRTLAPTPSNLNTCSCGLETCNVYFNKFVKNQYSQVIKSAEARRMCSPSWILLISPNDSVHTIGYYMFDCLHLFAS